MSRPEPDIAARLELALSAGREAGDMTLHWFGGDNYQVELKPDDSPVTVADRQAEQHLRQRIAQAFPDDGILGEEFGEQAGHSGFRWILDPIDGTKSFIHGVPFYGTLVGAERAGRSVLGLIYLPALGELVYACEGGGAWRVRQGRERQPARVSDCDRLSAGLFCTSDVGSFARCNRAAAYERLQGAARVSRTWGDCYGYFLVAVGRAAVMVDPIMNVWDAAALFPILVEAGGTFTDWQGQPTIHGGEGIATNGRVLAEVLAITRGH